MVKAFQDREKELLRERLLEKGRELFHQYGLKKTNIRELTAAVGIAQGSFYLFFGSKEELYFEILQEEEQTLKARLQADVFAHGEPGKEQFKRFLLHGMQLVEENAILRRVFLEDEYELMVRKLPPELIEQHIAADEDAFAPLIRAWQAAGYMQGVSAEAATGAVRAFFLTSLHKKEIGEEIFAETQELLAECLAVGLMRKGGEVL
ncbi:hypothetical protein CBW65_03410 [Tumebacillus avium]|uniref:HTH tetR-type domain-containing protein n=1 Tax=Tumebacillus avium TaxID=1903704 RepID=A0A1Y0IIT3_9BACL|nr:TetR/AcrR family transcriptional regulator [Tumebacillus avium]ARU60210.1 hypothetical protein CBW65_03410 [Tumebacillus avium]